MQVLPKEGIGDVRFGMKPSEVIAVFNEEQHFEGWMGGNLNDSLLFHGIVFGFDDCNSSAPLPDSQLLEVRINNREDLILWGKPLKGWTQASLKQYLDENKIFYQEEINKDWSFPFLWMALSFGESDRIEYLEMWTNDEDLVPSINRRKLAQSVIKTLFKR